MARRAWLKLGAYHMSGLEDRRRAPRKSASASRDFFVVLALGITGLAVSAIVTFSVATPMVLAAWTHPM
jgi:hypothetical protein